MKKVAPFALLSVSDKTGIVELASELVELRIRIFSTGGTSRTLRDAKLPVTEVSQYTGFPEIMDGRVKTLHPKIYGGILGRERIDDDAMQEYGIIPIGLVVVNLYPFEDTIAKPECTDEEAIENIDIGGPSMLRAAAKNHKRVMAVVDPEDYGNVLRDLQAERPDPDLRRALAKKVFVHTARYDRAIADYL